MKLRIAHTGKHDLIVQSNGKGTFRLRPLTWWELLTRQYVGFNVDDNELIVIRSDAACDPDGVPIKNFV